MTYEASVCEKLVAGVFVSLLTPWHIERRFWHATTESLILSHIFLTQPRLLKQCVANIDNFQEDLFRSNVTESETGVPLEARITVLDTDCNPVVGAFVDIWNCESLECEAVSRKRLYCGSCMHFLQQNFIIVRNEILLYGALKLDTLKCSLVTLACTISSSQ